MTLREEVARPADDQEPVILHCSKGAVPARIGDRFVWWDNTEWEIVSFSNERIYSPSGFGGAQIVTVRHVSGDVDPITSRFMDGELSEWCGDSVGAGLFNTRAREIEMLGEG